MTEPWVEDANCVGRSDVDWDADLVTGEAANVCGTCKVRTACFLAAIDREAKCDVGIWGGTSVSDRRRIREGRLDVVDVWQAAGYPYRDGEVLAVRWDGL